MGRDTHLLLGRLFLVALYLQSALGKWAGPGGVAAAIEAHGWPAPWLFAAAAAGGELAGAAGVAAGLATRTAAYGLVAYTVLATLTFHAFWASPDPATAEAWFLHAGKNLGLVGGFLVLAAAGPGRLSVDARLRGLKPAALGAAP